MRTPPFLSRSNRVVLSAAAVAAAAAAAAAVLPSLLVLSCNRGGDDRSGTLGEPLSDVVTLEMSFGAENVPEDLMLVSPTPWGLDVTPEGNVHVLDENWVKVYDAEGNAVTRFGGEGDGPGEFRSGRDLFVSPTGYTTVFCGYMGYQTHYFRPDHSFLDRVNYATLDPLVRFLEEKGLRIDTAEALYCLNETDRLYLIGGRDRDREKREHREIFLIHQTGDSLHALAGYAQTDEIIGGGMRTSALGVLLMAPLAGNRAVYLHTFHDCRFGPEEFTYTLTIIDLSTGESSRSTHPFVPVELVAHGREWTDEQKRERPDMWRRLQDVDERTALTYAERVYSAPVLRIETDDHFIFAYTLAHNDSSEIQVDVFNADTARHVCSAWFPPDGFIVRIENGCLYKFNDYQREEDFVRVERYRIDPRVYGRR